MMRQCRFNIISNKRITLMGDIDNRKAMACVGAGSYVGSYLPLIFALNLKLL